MNIDIKTADGEEIELGGAYYDGRGTEYKPVGIRLVDYHRITEVSLSCLTGKVDKLCCVLMRPDELYSTPPDSWEKLEEDIRRIGTDDCTWFCVYANENPVKNACPDSCKFFEGDEITCRKKLADDILSRIRKLRGEGDA